MHRKLHSSTNENIQPEPILDSALQMLYPGSWHVCHNHFSGDYNRAEIQLTTAEPLAFLHYLTSNESTQKDVFHYWSDRNGSLECAGIGSATEISSNSSVSFAEICEKTKRVISCDRQRLYGGFRFQRPFALIPDDTLWSPFGNYRFILPRVELTKSVTGTILACNFHNSERNSLSILLDDLKAKCHKAVHASAAIFSNENEVVALGSQIHKPNLLCWRKIVSSVLERIEECLNTSSERLEKIVLARRTSIHLGRELPLLSLLHRLRLINPMAYHFALQPKPRTTFFGASPELLLRISKGVLHTEALAGTRPRGDTPEKDSCLETELLNSQKELREHSIVHHSISESLNKLCTEVYSQEKVQIRKLPNVQHLYTSFKGNLRPGIDLAEVLQQLHPTPAVGGHPANRAHDLINATETFDRGWYAGPVGWIGSTNSEFAVGIRAGITNGDTLHLYAGNGIVKGSRADEEWAELDQKILQTLNAI